MPAQKRDEGRMGVRGLTVVPLLISIANAVSRRLLKKAEYAKAERINAIIAKLPSAVLTCDDLKVGAPILAMEPIQQTLHRQDCCDSPPQIRATPSL